MNDELTPLRSRRPRPTMMTFQRGEIVLGGFALLERLGDGAHATAFRASQVGMDRDAVVKIARMAGRRDDLKSLMLERFEVEVRAASRLSHPNIVTVYAAGDVRGAPALAMEYISGPTLDEYITTHGAMGAEDFLRVFSMLASALAFAHEARIIHRDVSSTNVMLTSGSGGYEPKLLDFGIAQIDGASPDLSSLGTPLFMAPEVLDGHVSEASDVYSLGVLMWYALTGESYLGKVRGFFDVIRKLPSLTAPPAPTVRHLFLPDEVQDVLTRSLQPDPSRRVGIQEVARCLVAAHESMSGVGRRKDTPDHHVRTARWTPRELANLDSSSLVPAGGGTPKATSEASSMGPPFSEVMTDEREDMSQALFRFMTWMSDWLVSTKCHLDEGDTRRLTDACVRLSARACALGMEEVVLLSCRLRGLPAAVYRVRGAVVLEQILDASERARDELVASSSGHPTYETREE